jgi:septal ring factor EnvC (AmiA/AmiB activator)
MLTDKLKLALACSVAFLLLLLIIPLGIHSFVLKSQLTQAESDLNAKSAELMIKQMEVTGLANSISDQNDKITELEKKTKAMYDARIEAQKEASGRLQKLSDEIARLEQEKLAGCTASGIRKKILNEVMR